MWLTCLVFFQTMLLVGYLYAHWLARGSGGLRGWVYLISLVVAVLLLAAQRFFSIALERGSDHPVTTIFLVLGMTIGLPAFRKPEELRVDKMLMQPFREI